MRCSHREASILRQVSWAFSHLYMNRIGSRVTAPAADSLAAKRQVPQMICQGPWEMCSLDQGNVHRKTSKRSRRFIPAVCFQDNTAEQIASIGNTSLSCTTFNILAPIYKRMNGEESRESQFREDWLDRNQKILEMLLKEKSSIICLQEFWLGNEELVRLYEQSLGTAGYDMYKLARPNGRGDGLFTAVKKDVLRVLDYQELPFHDCGDRVAQFLRLQSNIPMYKDCLQVVGLQEVLLVNTHLIFPHNSNFCLVRLRQVYKILKYLEQYKEDHNLSHAPVLLCGDWNGSKRGQVYKFLRSQGFVSSYDVAHHYTDADAHRWVSHRNHRGNICGVDFIWLLNPSRQRESLRESWKKAVFGIIKSKLLREHGKQGRDAFCFFQQNDCEDCVTYDDFHVALSRLELTKEDLEGLSREEIEELIKTADFDGNGVIDYEEFQETLLLQPLENRYQSWSTGLYDNRKKPWTPSPKLEALTTDILDDHSDHFCLVESSPELDVRHASFHPPEVEQGTWPENYSLSDHAPLTAVFTPVYSEQRPHRIGNLVTG